MKKFIKNNIKFIIVIAICLFGSILTTIAAGNYLFNSKDIEYDNTTSGIQSTNVSDAIDELYACASNYAAYNTRLSTVENNQVTFNTIYPIGSIYISVENTNPGTLFGGTWVSFGSGRTLVGVDTNDTSFDTVEETGGAKTVTLETSNLPSHSHYYTPSGSVSSSFTGTAVTSGANNRGHTHSVTAAGSVSQPTFTGTAVTSGANSRGHTHSVTAQGTVSKPSFTGTKTTTESAGIHGHSTANSASHGFATFDTTTDRNSTGVGYAAGGYRTFYAGYSTGVAANGSHSHYYTPSGSVSQPTFTGSAVTSGGESQNHTHSVTAAGTVSKPTFTGSAVTSGGESQNHTHSVTAAGSVSSTFTGTKTTTETTGSGTSFSTQDKYITVYMWKRTA